MSDASRASHASLPRPRLVATQLGPIEICDVGAGRPLLTIHGGMGGWDQGLILAQCLFGRAPAFRLINVSRPGYLGTPQNARRAPADQADLLAALLDALGLERALVAAVSAGGPSAISFAARHADRCAGLILISACSGHLEIPAGAARRLPFIRLAARLRPLGELVSLAARLNPGPAARRSILDPDVQRRTLRHPEAGPLLIALQNSVASRLSERLSATLNDVTQFQAMAPLPFAAVRAPLLAVHGTGDRVVPLAHLERIAKARPDARLLKIANGEHVCLCTHLDAVRSAAADFVAALSWR
ncbi:MAG: alpha/beta hydrolase [Pseudomonadota bacterium]